ncbi:MAG: translation initiation factor IF-2 [Candidatus Omnitrophica bacterium]|nr:translation initiation factor IF-2 [Candidatus Omnitrophota bacterium]
MKVSDLAKDINTSVDTILQTLKSFKLKAKDGDQDLSAAVVSVVRSELVKAKKTTSKAPAAKAVEKTQEAKPKVRKQPTAVKTTKKAVKKAEPPVKPALAPAPAPVPPPPKPAVKPKMTISNEPMITLKPLARKKRRVMGGPSTPEMSAHPATAEQTAVGSARLTTTTSAATPVMEQMASVSQLVDLEVQLPVTVKDFSTKIQQKPSIVLKSLMKMGILAHINQSLDGEIVNRLAKEFGYNIIKIKTQEEQLVETHRKADDDPKLLKPRAPVITFMGHVDHGKTSLLDCVRKSKVTDTEHGGITQHIGAYSVELPKGRITFLDTPGHEAFTAMRARGAHITDIVVLVVAADEGVMPQTDEAIDHARAANVPIVVALNKIDRKNADPDRVKKQLAERGLNPEDWGGKTIVVGVSALTGQGVDQLLELILLEAELLELKANPDKKASGIVVDAHLSPGKGAVTTLIVQGGTLRDADTVVVGSYYGRVRAMIDDRGRTIKEAGPSMPIEILGLSDVPEAGELFYAVEDERQAREITLKRQEERKNQRLQMSSRITLEGLYAQIQDGQIKELNVIIKADVQGSLEALKDSLGKIPSDKVKIRFIHLGVGEVNASDVILAVASKAIIIAFHVGIDQRAKEELEKQPVDVRKYRIIYDAVNDIRNALEGMLEAKTRKKFLGRVEIREVFKLSKHGIVAGCYVTKGRITRKDHVDIIRNDAPIYSGTVSSLKRFKDDVREVTEGMECGISFSGFDQFLSGDMVEAYELEKITQKL